MKKINLIIWSAYITVMAILHAACADSVTGPTSSEGSMFYPQLHIGVSNMTMTEDTRALEPMSPDLEKYVRSIAIFEFDNEGIHNRRSTSYHFIDFIRGTIDNIVPEKGTTDIAHTDFGIVETTLKGIALEERSNGTLCLVANVSETQVNDFYEKIYNETGQSYGRVTFDQFKNWALPFEYEEPGSIVIDGKKVQIYDESSSGYVKNMYMFGYYKGPIDPAEPTGIWVDLGRLASRLDITIINETGKDIDKRFGYHFDNVCHSAYFFPIKMSMPPTEGAGLSRTVICAGIKDGKRDPVEGEQEPYTIPEIFPDNTKSPGQGTHTRYFYVAAHSAKDKTQATKLHLFYDHPIVADENFQNEKYVNIQIPLCNVNPSEAGSVVNGYSLSRNTRYHFTIRVKSSSASGSDPTTDTDPANPTAATRAAASTQSATNTAIVKYHDHPGEITVYLP